MNYQANTYKRVSTDGIIKTGPGFLHSIVIQQGDALPTAGQIKIFDALNSAGSAIFQEEILAATFSPYSIVLDFEFTTGLYIDFITVADVPVTICYS